MHAGIRLEKVLDRTDYDYAAQLLFNEPVMKMNMGRVFTPEEAEQYFTFILEYGKSTEVLGAFKAFRDADGAFIGIASLMADGETAEVEYMLLPEFWHRGYASEILRMLTELARQVPALHKIRGLTAPGNLPSKCVLEKNGFSFEKSMRVEEDGSSVDVYSMQL